MVIAVKQSHHALNHGRIGPSRITCKNLTYMISRCHPRIQIDGLSTRRNTVKLRINIVRTAFERLHTEPPPRKCTQQPHRESSLATARRGGPNEYPDHSIFIRWYKDNDLLLILLRLVPILFP